MQTSCHRSGQLLTVLSRRARSGCWRRVPWGAATLHFAYSPSHLAEYWLYGVFFVALAWLQMLWAIGVVLRPTRQLLIAGIVANAAVIVVWVLSRTVGVWVGPNATVSEPATYPDILSTALEALIVVGGILVLFAPRLMSRGVHLRWVAPVAASSGIVLVAAAAGFGLSPQYAAAHDHAARKTGRCRAPTRSSTMSSTT